MLKHIRYKDVTVNSRLGSFYIDKDGHIDNISEELESLLLSIPNEYSKVDEPKEVVAEEPEVIEEEVEDVEDVEEAPNLNDMSVKELRAFAKEKGVKLTATKKADIINEILAEM